MGELVGVDMKRDRVDIKWCRITSNETDNLEYFKAVFKLATQSLGLKNTLELR